MTNKILDNFSDQQKNLNMRIFDIIFARTLIAINNSLPPDKKREMETLFSSDDDKSKKEFLIDKVPDFKLIFDKEAKKLEEELKQEIDIIK